jgi:phosphoribosylformylglycinamidine synthase PurS subunit
MLFNKGGRTVMKAKVIVTLKNGVLDPQGKAAEESLHSLGFKEVSDLRIGRYMELDLNDTSHKNAEKRLKEMCEKLLANPIIEDYKFEING